MDSLKVRKNAFVKKVLLVDDDRFSQALVTNAIASKFEVTSETSGANAVTAAEAVQPHLILLDLAMPNVDGYEVLMRLKKHPALASIPVICLSGKQDETSRARAYTLGASGFIQKPVNVKMLSEDIESLMNSMNSEISSADGRKTVFVGFNMKELRDKIKNDIEDVAGTEKNVVVLSFAEGADFFSHFPDSEKFSQDKKVAYLQVKPAFITRLPYLENLSAITGELKALIDADPSEYVLLFEGPDAAFGNLESENSKAGALLLGQAMSQLFPKVRYYMKTSSEQTESSRVNDLAKLLIGYYP